MASVICRVYYDLQSLYFCVVWGLPLKIVSVDTLFKSWLRHIRKINLHFFTFCAHVIKEHQPCWKNMVYWRLFKGRPKRAQPSQPNPCSTVLWTQNIKLEMYLSSFVWISFWLVCMGSFFENWKCGMYGKWWRSTLLLFETPI